MRISTFYVLDKEQIEFCLTNPVRGIFKRIKSGDLSILMTCDLKQLPLPSFALLEMQCNLNRIGTRKVRHSLLL